MHRHCILSLLCTQPSAKLHTNTHTETDSRLLKWAEPVGGISGETEGGEHSLVGRDPQWTGAAGAGRPLAIQAAVAQEAALAALAVLANRVVLTVLEGEETGSGDPNWLVHRWVKSH